MWLDIDSSLQTNDSKWLDSSSDSTLTRPSHDSTLTRLEKILDDSDSTMTRGSHDSDSTKWLEHITGYGHLTSNQKRLIYTAHIKNNFQTLFLYSEKHIIIDKQNQVRNIAEIRNFAWHRIAIQSDSAIQNQIWISLDFEKNFTGSDMDI